MRMTRTCGYGTSVMYVCLCNGFTDRCVDRAIDAGARTVSQVYRGVGCKPQCGKCIPTVRAQLDERKAIEPVLAAVG